ncbi:MAG: hypothetical protein ACYCPT_07370 [Acidimicrobiales bacterium]
MSRIDEDFELELRSLPGVLNVGFTRNDASDVTAITLVVSGPTTGETQSVAMQIASLYYPDAEVAVQDVNEALHPMTGRAARAVLVRAEFNSTDGMCDVELNLRGRIGTGRAGSGPLIGAVEATLAALRNLDLDVPFTLTSVSNLITVKNWPVVVVLRSLTNDADRYGIAHSDSDVAAASKATLSAVNRFLAQSGT